LSITGKRKMPRKEKWIDINPELIELDVVLKELEITREQLILIGMLVGTDYNPNGVAGFGPKKALSFVKEKKTLEQVLKNIEWNSENDPEEIFNFFVKPRVSDNYEIKFREIDVEKVKKILVDEHEFSEERVENNLKKVIEIKRKGSQSKLSGWFKAF
ncbi:MAG: flap structure-specific endonuclease, partial [Candidatus Aenigmarchaeota archaeon]|nr:flap structure-specific endonuclease [Candidatus Aenigmarchaeota archaeon]